jgi:hypothetical protein
MNEARKQAEELLTATNESSDLVGQHLTAVKALRKKVAEATEGNKEALETELAAADEVFKTELARYKALRKQAAEAHEASIKLTPEEEEEFAGYVLKYTGKPWLP